MIVGIKGTVDKIYPESVGVDVNGVVYEIHMAEPHLATLGQIGDFVELYTYMRLTNDVLMIYGFAHAEQLNMFHKLITVNSVGPRNAQSILGYLELSQITDAILTENTALLVGVPGIGARTASRIVLELKDKIDLSEDATFENTGRSDKEDEIVDALQALGYSRTEIASVLATVEFDESDLGLEERIKIVLSRMV